MRRIYQSRSEACCLVLHSGAESGSRGQGLLFASVFPKKSARFVDIEVGRETTKQGAALMLIFDQHERNYNNGINLAELRERWQELAKSVK